MKPKYKIVIVIVVLVIIFTNIFVWMSINNKVLIKSNTEHYRNLTAISQIEEAIQLSIKLDSYKIDDSYPVYDTLGNMHLISEICDNNVICLKFSKYACEDCISHTFNYLKNQFVKNEIIVITDCFDYLELNRKRKELDYSAAYYYTKIPLFQPENIDHGTLLFLLKNNIISKPLLINPKTIEFIDMYFNLLHSENFGE